LLQCSVYDGDIILINDDPAIGVNSDKFSSVLRLQVSDETIIKLFPAW